MTGLAAHITAFLRERLPRERGASPHTCDTYAHSYRLLFAFAAKQVKVAPSALRLEQIDASLVLAFLAHLERERKNSPVTRNVRLAAIKSFMRFVEHREPSALEQIRQILAIPAKKTDTRVVDYLVMDEMQALLDAPDPGTKAGIRDRAMLHVAFSAGLRVSELVGLRLDSLTFEPRLCIRVLGKGRRERALPLWKETAAALRAWLAVRGPVLAPEVFVNRLGDAMTRSGFEYILARHCATAAERCPSLRQKRVSPHVLRHTCAMMTLRGTGDVRKVALWLGHASIQTTETYLRADPTARLDVLNAVTPPGLRKGRFRPPDKLIALLAEGAARRDYAEHKATPTPLAAQPRSRTRHNR